ncbi:EamA family transporter [Acuticoccus yangtzensis]|uniref:EamA family transporter n=1 Tax=Acuticoccus yangtzensis TaxID=1443441 RepID=UPI000949540B|nr:EamA family transporter [Acuticoccus yangtzensis]ORE90129.1 DMT superfamily permease [Stappia sp. 22II-S9-Z10]
MTFVPLWVLATLGAAAAQTARNAMQRHLTASLGTLGATLVRFLYGLPFAVLFLALAVTATGDALPTPSLSYVALVAIASALQIAATALMLAAMRITTFSITVAYTKTEPVQVALFGFVMLGERLSALSLAGIVAATVGVMLMSQVKGTALAKGLFAKPALFGLASAACFAGAAVLFRAGILSLGEGGPVVRASATLVWAQALQCVMLGGWLLATDRAVVAATLKAWRQSVFAGAMGALASQLWFIGFALTSTANVRTLGLVEVLFAQAVSRRLAETTTPRQIAGILLAVAGVAALIAGHG